MSQNNISFIDRESLHHYKYPVCVDANLYMATFQVTQKKTYNLTMHLGYILIIFSQLLSSWTHNGGLNVDAVYCFLSVDFTHKTVEHLHLLSGFHVGRHGKKRDMYDMNVSSPDYHISFGKVILGMNSPNGILD